MQRVILIRFGEIFLKGNNKGYFESALVHNIKNSLRDFDYEFKRAQNRYMIENYKNEEEGELLDCLLRVFGIHSVSVAVKIATDLAAISKVAVELMSEKTGKFRVTVNRADKRVGASSTAVAADIGGDVLDSNKNVSVDLFDFDTELFVDIRENGFTYLFTDKLMGANGMPVGTAGHGLVLLSGGIDSPVAAYCMAKRGMKLSAIHFHSAPYTSEMAKEKVVDLAKLAKRYAGSIKLNVVPFTDIQLEIHQHCPPEFMITIMRRFMMRIAERLAKTHDCGAIITGESLGQVASQTVESITVTNSVIETLPVFRPLIGMDKSEIIDIAKKIGTFDTSILPYEDCCTIFLPKNPVIRPKLDVVAEAEAALDVEGLIEKAIANIEVINC